MDCTYWKNVLNCGADPTQNGRLALAAILVLYLAIFGHCWPSRSMRSTLGLVLFVLGLLG